MAKNKIPWFLKKSIVVINRFKEVISIVALQKVARVQYNSLQNLTTLELYNLCDIEL